MQDSIPNTARRSRFLNPDEHFTAAKIAIPDAEKTALVTLLSRDNQEAESVGISDMILSDPLFGDIMHKTIPGKEYFLEIP